ncbi:hypothetical protein FRC07_008990, partial [Ceratobasidium sp. 392]
IQPHKIPAQVAPHTPLVPKPKGAGYCDWDPNSCVTIVAIFALPGTNGTIAAVPPAGRNIHSPLELLELYIPPDQLPHPRIFDRWHVVWAVNTYDHFTAPGDEARMKNIRLEMQRLRVQSLLLVFRHQESRWYYGWVWLLVSRAITPLATQSGDEHPAYLQSWTSEPFVHTHLDMAVLTGDGTATAYLAAPFSIRPFGQNIRPISKHRLEAGCVIPFEAHETPSERYREARWVLASEDFRAPQKSLAQWRERQENLEITHPCEDLTRVYVGCSWCGTGSFGELDPGTYLHKGPRDYYVSIPW